MEDVQTWFVSARDKIIAEILQRVKLAKPDAEFRADPNLNWGGTFIIDGLRIMPFRFSRDTIYAGFGTPRRDTIIVRGDDYKVGRRSFKELKNGGHNYDALADYVIKAFRVENRNNVESQNYVANLPSAERFEKYQGKGIESSFYVQATKFSPESDGPIELVFRYRAAINVEQAQKIVDALLAAGLIEEKQEPSA